MNPCELRALEMGVLMLLCIEAWQPHAVAQSVPPRPGNSQATAWAASAWQPVGTSAVPNMQPPPSPESPYYTDSPLYLHRPVEHWPQSVTPPMITQAPAEQASTTPFPSTIPSPPPPTNPAEQPMPIGPPATTDIVRTSAESAPFVDGRFAPGVGHEWREYDISGYTSQFPESVNAERAIHHWIWSETGSGVWHGMETAALRISPQRVSVYHNSQVHEKIADLLGRFIYYLPGNYQCRVSILNATDVQWQSRYARELEPTEDQAPGRNAWLIDHAAANRLVGELSDGRAGVMLVDRRFVIANGQWAKVRRAAKPAQSGSASLVERPATAGDWMESEAIEDGEIVRLSPLVAPDAVSIDVDYYISVSRVADTALQSVRDKATRDVSEFDFSGRARVIPGKQLLVSMGMVPAFDPASRTYRDDLKAELLVLVAMSADQSNAVAGTPVEIPMNQATVKAAPPQQRVLKPAKRPDRQANVPEVLTRAVFN